MTARRIDGKLRSQEILDEVAARSRELSAKGTTPTLAMMRIGEDPASIIYLRKKAESSAAVGVASRQVILAADADPADARKAMLELNQDPEVHGILLQLPLPEGFDATELLNLMDPAKDVDGLHPTNVGRLVRGEPAFVPCTPLGVFDLLLHEGVDLQGKLVAILGRSNLVGCPLSNLLSQKGEGRDATVILLHSRSKQPELLTRQADVLVAAAGQAGVVTKDMVKPGATVIDVGIHRVPNPEKPGKFRLVGDVAADVKDVAEALTPVPGGVGPMTVAMLMRNTVDAAAGLTTRPLEVRDGAATG